QAVPGLAVVADPYRLVPEATTHERGRVSPYRFKVVADDGETVHDFDIEHERRMHLIVVRRDFASFQHLHPEQVSDGSWQTDLELNEGGVYRVFADFATGGRSLTLATDLFVAGAFDPVPLAAPEASAEVGGGYEVTLDSAAPSSGSTNPARFTVSRDGRKLDSVEPYLGADGHLVALREHDQAFLHTHPQGEPGGPGPISFAVEYPSAGRYRLFLQFKHRGEVRTAAFTEEVDQPGISGGSVASAEEADHAGH
ncbi:MAG: hypothetical protein WKF62_04390, partial [Solirubrobacterales bacterium]